MRELLQIEGQMRRGRARPMRPLQRQGDHLRPGSPEAAGPHAGSAKQEEEQDGHNANGG